ncbi:uncharacterized protein BP01DRAFT_385817 [Aspergillus saccharolyticus JOP 1030-1]|uniref:Uncharacterized protein n=1 Tax=Aspergillus saccharolyticus JOP 1030-1 TaxID=1450539 RepID=A0A319A3Y5_9EURO|nr:hypothetical protein BP01DRAFT_385817 [Aspergillus saccharolyticus JOP 1030-1]PYH42152.1 hypothetical protein BP01DRAFT_385817 [Aspergillus saccharolyticus JOP 1030-1]
MNFFSWLFPSSDTTSPPRTQEHTWDPKTVTMQQPVSPQTLPAEVPTTAAESGELSMRGGGEAGNVCCGV